MKRCLVAVVVPFLFACLPPLDSDCQAAKDAICPKLLANNCSTALLEEDVNKLKSSCGSTAAEEYLTKAEADCKAGTLVCGAAACGDPKTVKYDGTLPVDGRAAHLELTFQGTSVRGTLRADAVCGASIQLPNTEINFPAAVLNNSKVWEDPSATITGAWTGGDWACNGTKLTGSEWPENGNVTISVSGSKVYLQRVANGSRYEFTAQGKVYEAPDCSADAGATGCHVTTATPNPVYTTDDLTISGSGFGTTQGKVWFISSTGSSMEASYYNSWTDTLIDVRVPDVSSEGLYTVKVMKGTQDCGSVSAVQIHWGGCVQAGTQVSMADGSHVAIESLSPGAEILALDPETRSMRKAFIREVLVHNDASYDLDRLELTDGQTLMVTDNHPILTRSGAWVPVEKLVPGEVVYTFDTQTGEAKETTILSIIRDESRVGVVYNLRTSAGNYFANDILVHNKCLARGSLVDTPHGAKPVQLLQPGDQVWGERNGQRVVTTVTRVFTKTTVLPALAGKHLAPDVRVTGNHRVRMGGTFVAASQTPAADEPIAGTVYDLETDTGNYFAGNMLLEAGR